MYFFPLSFSGSGRAKYVNKDIFHNSEAVKQHVVWSTENLILLLILTSISTMSVIAFNTSIVIQSWRVLFIVWIYPLDYFASSGGKRDCEGEYLRSASYFFPSPVHCISFHQAFILAFFFCFLFFFSLFVMLCSLVPISTSRSPWQELRHCRQNLR